MSLITLAMPVYNVERYIERALLSALNQSYPELEILVVDDQGNDKSMEIVYQIQERHPRGSCIRVITHKRNLGLGGTRSTAIEQARGKYLYFMDSDDVITPDCIRSLYAVMDRESVDYVAAGISKVDDGGNSIRLIQYPDIVRRGEFCMAQYLYGERGRIWMTTWNKLYDLTFLRHTGISFMPHLYHEDEPVHAQLALDAQSFALMREVTYFHQCKRDDSITNLGNGCTPKHLNDSIIVYREIRRIIDSDVNLSKTLRKRMNLYYLIHVFHKYSFLMWANMDKMVLRSGLKRLSSECIPPFWETRFTMGGMCRLILLKIPFYWQYKILKIAKNIWKN